MAHQCSVCRSTRDCIHELAWYPFGAIRMCRNQIKWLLENYSYLELNMWPPEFRDGNLYSSNLGHNAHFVNATEMRVMLDARLDRCGKDGKLARRYFQDTDFTHDIATVLGKDINRVFRTVMRVVRYCSGTRDRILTYPEFCANSGRKQYALRVKSCQNKAKLDKIPFQ